MGPNNAIRATVQYTRRDLFDHVTGRKTAVIYFSNLKVKGSNYWISGSFEPLLIGFVDHDFPKKTSTS